MQRNSYNPKSLEISNKWRARKGAGRIITGKDNLEKMASKWQVINPLLISEPGSKLFIPVLQSSHLKK